MSLPDAPVPSQADRIESRLDSIEQLQGRHTDAVNQVGEMVKWIVDNVKDIFAMFGNPQMMGMMSGMMAGIKPEMPDLTGDASDDTAGTPAAGAPAAESGYSNW